MTDVDLTGAVFHKSTRSSADGDCVEVADNLHNVVAVRDSKNPDEATLTFTSTAWSSFVAEVKAGNFDR